MTDEQSYLHGHLSKCKHCGAYIEKRAGHQVCRSGDPDFSECWHNRQIEKMTDKQFEKHLRGELK